jgi:hypothetical protein
LEADVKIAVLSQNWVQEQAAIAPGLRSFDAEASNAYAIDRRSACGYLVLSVAPLWRH